MSAGAFVAALSEATGIDLPDRYVEFLTSGAHADLPILHLREGYVRGYFAVDHLDDNLTELEDLAEEHWIDDLFDIDWAEDFEGFVPFATLVDAGDPREPGSEGWRPVRSFLVIDASNPACPVLLWDYDGWTLYPLARSLDDYTAGEAWGADADAGDGRSQSFGQTFEAFGWIDSDAVPGGS